jgi:short-subunit dehydrogenase
MTVSPLSGRHAAITGATGGMGRCVAERLARAGAKLILIGRNADALRRIETELSELTTVQSYVCDLDRDDDVVGLRPYIERYFDRRLDILVHTAGVIAMGRLESVPLADLDKQYRINVRAPLLLTQSVLPFIRAARGQIVFVNSTMGVRTKENAGGYAASKHALKAIAETLRAELNASGVRVLSVFPGNTATAMQQQVCRELGTTYRPQAMLQADDVAAALVNALALPPTAMVTDLHILPAEKPAS